MAEKAMLIDTSKCMACRACQVACKQWWELPGESTTQTGTYENPPDLSAETWTKIKFTEIGDNGTVKWLFRKLQCLHCTEAVCVKVCPTYARAYQDLGYVTIDENRCIGCARCMAYCPFQVPRLGSHDVSARIAVEIGPARSVAYKCVLCKDRIENGLSTNCTKTCPTGAIQFGPRVDLVEQGLARVDTLKATYPDASLYGENELGGLHVMYVLTEESSVYGLPTDPEVGTYSEFPEDSLPGWYIEAITHGQIPAFPRGARPEWYLQPIPELTVGGPGEPGATGPTGPAGQTGSAGPEGPGGQTGSGGQTGPAGPEGPGGQTGPAGSEGPEGAEGMQWVGSLGWGLLGVGAAATALLWVIGRRKGRA